MKPRGDVVSGFSFLPPWEFAYFSSVSFIMMNPLVALLLVFFTFSSCLKSQSGLSSSNRRAVKLFEEAQSRYDQRKTEDAYRFLQDALKEDPQFFEANLFLADICLDLGKPEEALPKYEAASKAFPDKFPAMYLRWAQAELKLMKYTDAAGHLEKFMSYPKVTEESKKKARRLLANARFADGAVKNPVPYTPENMGEAINTEFSEYHPAITVDQGTLIYTRLRPADALTDNGSRVEEDFYVSFREDNTWTKSIPAGEPLNTHGNEGAHCLSQDGRFVYFTGCNRAGGWGSCDIYVSEKRGGKWQKPVNLGEAINGPKWDSQPSISPDGQELIFTSARPGGKGGKDLWVSKRNAAGNWEAAVNLGDSLNTEFDESGPFLHPDGSTLFFSSDGHPGMGEKDLYYSRRLASGGWSKPVNLGYPLNTAGDETYLVVSADGKTAYLSAEREGGLGQLDLYSFSLHQAARPQPVTFLRGKVQHARMKNPIEASVEITDLFTKEVKARCTSDPITGGFLLSLPAGSSYALNVSAPGFLFYSENYTLKKELSPTDVYEVEVGLIPVEKGERIVLNNIFFESGSAALQAKSQAELETLLRFLLKNPALQIEIGGHTDDVGNDDANLKLSQSRAEAVKQFLTEKGIPETRITAKGYGEAKPVASNQNEEGRSRNRRTEFTILAK